MTHLRLLLPTCLFAAVAIAQPVSFGVRGGVPLESGNDSSNRYTVDRDRWTVGPTLQINLPARTSIGADLLYRRYNNLTIQSLNTADYYRASQVHHWELPVYVSHRFAPGPISPFVRGGLAFQRAAAANLTVCSGTTQACGSNDIDFNFRPTSWGGGWLVGAGLRFNLGPLKIEPEFRYTRWVKGYFNEAAPNQPALLVGLFF